LFPFFLFFFPNEQNILKRKTREQNNQNKRTKEQKNKTTKTKERKNKTTKKEETRRKKPKKKEPEKKERKKEEKMQRDATQLGIAVNLMNRIEARYNVVRDLLRVRRTPNCRSGSFFLAFRLLWTPFFCSKKGTRRRRRARVGIHARVMVRARRPLGRVARTQLRPRRT
jgi:hypothetical protein